MIALLVLFGAIPALNLLFAANRRRPKRTGVPHCERR